MIRNFSLEELTRSQKARELGIDNSPPSDHHTALVFTLAGLERVRAFLGHPMTISSGYRSPALNKAIGGVYDSQHSKGEAVDFVCPGFGSPRVVVEALAKARHSLGIDQLILEPTWVHISFTPAPRGVVLTKVGKGYREGIV